MITAGPQSEVTSYTFVVWKKKKRFRRPCMFSDCIHGRIQQVFQALDNHLPLFLYYSISRSTPIIFSTTSKLLTKQLTQIFYKRINWLNRVSISVQFYSKHIKALTLPMYKSNKLQKNNTVLTLHIQYSSIGGSISKFVTRHTSIFSGVCPNHISYCELLFVC